MADLFSDNPLVGFKAFREAHAGEPGANPRLAECALTTRGLAALRADVVAGKLPQVSFIISTAAESEHPGPSSPAQGADFTARTIEALTADPQVWSRTVLLVMFDENDGFFDHVPPPAPPSRLEGRALAGASTVDTTGEYHLQRAASEARADPPELMGRPYGLGPRAPMYVISPWSRGGFVNSQVFDHTSVIRFLEKRFGVMEPNISPWRRSVCGDLTSAFDFQRPNDRRLARPLPATRVLAERAKALAKKVSPPAPRDVVPPVQTAGPRPSRALPYALEVNALATASGVDIGFLNRGAAGAVLHVYDRLNLAAIPRRYTLDAGHSLEGHWPGAPYDLWILGPNGFHRQIKGSGAADGDPMVSLDVDQTRTRATLRIASLVQPRRFKVAATGPLNGWSATAGPDRDARRSFSLGPTRGWYDLTVTCEEDPAFLRRLAGRIETGRDSITDPAMGGEAIMRWS
jgi:phospholipase C